MSRRTFSILAAALLLLMALPAAPALASANSTARVTNAALQAVYPGSVSYGIQVTNTEMGILGMGTTINFVTIRLPSGDAGVTLGDGAVPAPSGWTATPRKIGQSHSVEYRGGSIAPAASTTFTVPTEVVRPLGSDRTGEFLVQVSSDNGATFRTSTPTGNGLGVKVMILEILQGSVRPTAPTNADNTRGVTNRTGTAGQTIEYAFNVRNHARGAVSVVGSLGSSNPPLDVPGGSVTRTLQAAGEPGDQFEYRIPVNLGPATGQRTTQFTANAVVVDKAVAPVRTDNFTVQVPVDLVFAGLDPTRVRSISPSSRDFRVTVTRTGGPNFDLDSAALSFATNSRESNETTTGTITLTGQRQLTWSFPSISGPEGDHPATIDADGTDWNLADYVFEKGVGLIVIDNLAPRILDLVVAEVFDQDGDLQVAFKTGDQVSVSGRVVHGHGVDDLDRASLQVEIVRNAGPAINIPVQTTTTEEGLTFTGTATLPNDAAANDATLFAVKAEIRDLALNPGSAATANFLIDNVLPVLGAGSGRVLNEKRLRVQFTDNFADNIRGGCDQRAWNVDGTPGLVGQVHLSDGEPCTMERARALGNGVRILEFINNFEIDVDHTPTVTYAGVQATNGGIPRSLNHYPSKDGAGNDSARHTIETISDVIPVPPEILSVRRVNRYEGGQETAYLDPEEGRYYTATGGEDSIQVTVGNVRLNYVLQVRDQAGNVLAEKTITMGNSDMPPGADVPMPIAPFPKEGRTDINVPIGTTDGFYPRFLTIVSPQPASRPSNLVPLPIVLDTVEPTIAGSTLIDDDLVEVKFTEKIVFFPDPDRAQDWRVFEERDDGEGGTWEFEMFPDRVINIDEFTRHLEVSLPNPDRFTRAEYLFTSGSTQYEDRAGNRMQDSISFDN